MQTLPTTKKTYNLNSGQKAAAEAFFQFLLDPNQTEFHISGSAGVGKTYLMNYIIDETMPRYHEMCALVGMKPDYDDVVMTATTNQAAHVLGQACGRETQTIHSFLNLTVKENYKTGEADLTRTRNWRVHENKIVFIDEASMIDGKLDKANQEGTHNCKIVYVGDHSQLNPVQESISPIYTRGAPFFELTEPMRNKGQPALMQVCQQLRETVNGGRFKPIQLVDDVIVQLNDDGMAAMIAECFTQQTHDARILAYTNKRVIEFNDYIRQLRQLPRSYQKGEFLVSASAGAFGKNGQTLSVQAEVEIFKNHGPDKIEIEPDVWLDVEHLDFVNDFGDLFTRVPLPTDRAHYDALLKHYAKAKNWERFWFLKNQFVDLRPKDAATVHKAQGSTYDTVFVDLGNISTCNIPNQVARMLYVAFSRARTRVFLYGDLADKYGGLILP
jgi:hypothetical protein